jgi:hypothetical protein
MAHHSHSSRNALLMFSSKFPSHLYLQITFHHIRSFRSAEKTTGRTHSKQQHLWMCWGIHKLFFSFCSYRHLRPQAHNKIPQKLIQACRTHTSCLLEDQSTVCNQEIWYKLGHHNVALPGMMNCLAKRLAVANPWHVPYHTTLVTVGGLLSSVIADMMIVSASVGSASDEVIVRFSLNDGFSMMMILSLRSLGGFQRLIMLVK